MQVTMIRKSQRVGATLICVICFSVHDVNLRNGNKTKYLYLWDLTFCAEHVQWPLHLLGRACCCMMAPEMFVTENRNIKN